MVVLDTHAWIWWVSEARKLSRAARELIDQSEVIGIPVIACFEVVRAISRGRISLDRDPAAWVAQALSHPRARALEIGSDVAVQAALLDDRAFPGDSADRLIFATARARRAPLISRDRALQRFDPKTVVW